MYTPTVYCQAFCRTQPCSNSQKLRTEIYVTFWIFQIPVLVFPDGRLSGKFGIQAVNVKQGVWKMKKEMRYESYVESIKLGTTSTARSSVKLATSSGVYMIMVVGQGRLHGACARPGKTQGKGVLFWAVPLPKSHSAAAPVGDRPTWQKSKT